MPSPRSPLPPACALLLAACGPGAEDTDVADAAPTCVERIADTEAFALDPDGLPTQIHVAHAHDGDGVWVAWSAVDPSNAFVIVAGRLGCDGAWDVPPARIGGDGVAGHLDPTVAVGAEGALFAWQVDDGSAGDNLDIHTALLAGDGTVSRDAAPLAPTRDGAVNDGPDWMPHLAARPDGGFTLAGSWGIDEATGFQAFLQDLDGSGLPEGDARVVDLQPDRSQTVPTVTFVDGAAAVAWEGSDGVVTEAVVAMEDGEGFAVERVAGVAPEVAAGPGGLWSAWSVDDAPSIRVGTPAGEVVELGATGELEFGPTLAGGVDHVAVVWYRNKGGFDNALRIAWLDASGAVVGEERLRAGGVPPYDLNLSHVGDDTWFVAWQEGDNPDFLVHGQFVGLP